MQCRLLNATHLSKDTGVFKQKCTQLLTPFFDTCFMPFQMVCFVRKVSLNHLSDWWNFSNNQSETFIGTIFKAYTPRSFAIIGSFHAKGLEKSSSGNVVKSCVHFCFESLLDLENVATYVCRD